MFKKLTALFTVLIFAFTASFAGAVDVYVDGSLVTSDAEIFGGSAYVPLRALSNALLNEPDISWTGAEACVQTASLSLSAEPNRCYITANGRLLYVPDGVKLINGSTYVPVRALAKAAGASVNWDKSSGSVRLTRGSGYIISGEQFYSAESVYWLSRIISAESRGEPLEGKIGVGAVVLNRVASPLFPNTIYGVIFDDQYAVQFEPTANGTIFDTPTEESIIAAKLCLDGASNVGGSLYFLNISIASSLWITQNRTFVASIGQHSFYS